MIRKVFFSDRKKKRFMQTESVLKTKNRSGPAKNRFSVALTCTYNGAEKHVTCKRFENAASRAKTNVITTVHFTDDGASLYDCPGMLFLKTTKLCINSM